MVKNKAAIVVSIASTLSIVLIFQAFSPPLVPTATSTIFVDETVVDGARAAGDGTVDDRKYVLAAFAKIPKVGPSTLMFGKNKTYYLKGSDETDIIFKIDAKENATIDGQGSTLLLDVNDSAFLLTNNINITITDLKIAYTSTNFTQGTITNVYSDSFVVRLDAGYPYPNPQTASYGNSGVFDRNGNFLRDSEIFIDRTEVCPTINVKCPAGSLLVYPTDDTKDDLSKIGGGDKQIAFGIIQKDGRVFEIEHNKTVTLRNIEIYGSMGGSILASENEEEIMFDSIQIKRQPSTNRLIAPRLIATLADGFHIFGNRGHVTIMNSYIERILDDGINIGSMAEVAKAIDSSTNMLQLRSTSLGGNSPELKVGDTISAFNVSSSGTQYFLGSAKIVSPAPPTGYQRVRSVYLNKMIPGIKVTNLPDDKGGKNFTDESATRFFIDEISNPNFVVINNKITNKQRNGILARGPHGLVRKNTISNVGGSGIFAANTLKFNEGPTPVDIEISGNSISGVGDNGVVVAFNSYGSKAGQTVLSKSQVVNNIFDDLDMSSIKVTNIFDLNIAGNVLPSPDQFAFENLSGLSEEPVSSLFKIKGDTAVYFSSQLGYCKYKSTAALTAVWGTNYQSYLTTLGSILNGLKNKGDCGPNEGVYFVGTNSIQRVNRDGSYCRFGSMENLLMITGFTDADDLKRIPQSPAGTTDSGQLCNY